ncbi:class E sortase [Streptomyces hypolithicus]
MTSPRPGHDAGQGASYENDDAYGAAGAFEAAVEQLADPLNDPLPGQQGPGREGHPSPWFRSATVAGAYPPQQSQQSQQPQYPYYPQPGLQEPPQEPQRPQERYAAPDDVAGAPERPRQDWYAVQEPVPAAEPQRAAVPEPAAVPDPDSRTRRIVPAEPPAATGGRAERRRAAKSGKGGKSDKGGKGEAGRARTPRTPPPGSGGAGTLSRVEARRAARAAKDSPAVVASRFFGEVFISLGLLMLLFVTYQLWWTNVRADLFAGNETDKIQEGWAQGRKPGAFEPGTGFAIMHIPKLDVVVPVAEGIDKANVLDNGMVGHYAEGKLKTAMPSDERGNFAVAGHRNTHGEPFRYINQLKPGDPIVVETQDTYYTYEMASILPQTAPSNIGVIEPVPAGSGFTKPGRYITLTTCTPEFTSTYRMIVWGKMVDERPRSKGQPDALVG